MRSISHVLVVVIWLVVETTQQKFIIPDVAIQALKPKGLKISLPDSPGTQYFAFHGNVNIPIKGKEEGAISKDATRAINGVWTAKDENVVLKVGDVVHYWIFVQQNRLGFDKQEQKFTVATLEEDGSTPTFPVTPVETCTYSETTINGGQRTCVGTVIFEDDFNTLDETKWEKQYYIAEKPDEEFVTYEKQNIEISNGFLNLKATLRPNVERINSFNFINGCTGTKCVEDTYVGRLSPPIIAGQVKSKLSFKYGVIEIRAQLPKGDWSYPQLYLETRDARQAYNNGRIWLAYSRGNGNLKASDNQEIGNTVLYAGPVISTTEPVRTSLTKTINMQGGKRWGDEVHTFVFTWRRDSMSITVDGNPLHISNYVGAYDKELLVTLGIAAGGNSDFPNGVTGKPWSSPSIRSTRRFYEARNNWLPTWPNSEATLRVDSIKISAL